MVRLVFSLCMVLNDSSFCALKQLRCTLWSTQSSLHMESLILCCLFSYRADNGCCVRAPFDRYRSQGHSTWNTAALLPPALTSSTFTKKKSLFNREMLSIIYDVVVPLLRFIDLLLWFVLRVVLQTCVRSVRSPQTWYDWSSNNGPKLCPAVLTT